MSKSLFRALQKSTYLCKRAFSIDAPRWSSKRDPLEQLYEEKLQEYHKKSRGGKMFEPSPEILEEMQSELNRVAQKYGIENGNELEHFPKFEFDEPVIDPIIQTN